MTTVVHPKAAPFLRPGQFRFVWVTPNTHSLLDVTDAPVDPAELSGTLRVSLSTLRASRPNADCLATSPRRVQATVRIGDSDSCFVCLRRMQVLTLLPVASSRDTLGTVRSQPISNPFESPNTTLTHNLWHNTSLVLNFGSQCTRPCNYAVFPLLT